MRMVCFCGTFIDIDDEIAMCPKCHEIVSTMVTLPSARAQMEKELALFFVLWDKDLIN